MFWRSSSGWSWRSSSGRSRRSAARWSSCEKARITGPGATSAGDRARYEACAGDPTLFRGRLGPFRRGERTRQGTGVPSGLEHDDSLRALGFDPFRAHLPRPRAKCELIRTSLPRKVGRLGRWRLRDVFFRGEAEQVTLVMSGEFTPLRRLEGSDVWTATVERPQLARGVFSYVFASGKKGAPSLPFVQPLKFEIWTGPMAPPMPAVATSLKGLERSIDLESKELGEKRTIKYYLPPGARLRLDRIRCSTGPIDMTNAQILDPLVVGGQVCPVIVVAAMNGTYRGDRAKSYDITQDLRACEYLPEIDKDRFARHERFFCEELRTWAENELGATRARGTGGARRFKRMRVSRWRWDCAHRSCLVTSSVSQWQQHPLQST